MLTTSDPALDRKFRLLRQHGMSVPDTVRHASNTVVFEEYPIVGFNYRMTDIQAAVGRVQLVRLPRILARRIALANRYEGGLRSIMGLEAPFIPVGLQPNYQSYPVRVTNDFPIGRDALMHALLERGVSTRRGIMNAHQEEPYVGMRHGNLLHSEVARDHVVLLPLYDSMTEDDQDYTIEALGDIAEMFGIREAQ
jgi:dTDP-4-amino-4,6-dideoxygalactose transaminase